MLVRPTFHINNAKTYRFEITSQYTNAMRNNYIPV